ncbi:hypothetical protein TRVL_04848 [Trypanosoma vivax]|nr:hypothetical protein TRVL_04848 [Trypanosoma vivax]
MGSNDNVDVDDEDDDDDISKREVSKKELGVTRSQKPTTPHMVLLGRGHPRPDAPAANACPRRFLPGEELPQLRSGCGCPNGGNRRILGAREGSGRTFRVSAALSSALSPLSLRQGVLLIQITHFPCYKLTAPGDFPCAIPDYYEHRDTIALPCRVSGEGWEVKK